VSEGGKETVVGKLNDGATIKVETAPNSTYYKVGKTIFVQMYARILIKHRSLST
jgi:hypothetical protein